MLVEKARTRPGRQAVSAAAAVALAASLLLPPGGVAHADEEASPDDDAAAVEGPAVRRGATFHIGEDLVAGAGAGSFTFGRTDDTALLCDVDGDGVRTPAVTRRDGERLQWFFRASNAADAEVDVDSLVFGDADARPLCGDWNGDGIDGVGTVEQTSGGLAFTLADVDDFASGATSTATEGFVYGREGDAAVVGDWNGDGVDGVGGIRVDDNGRNWFFFLRDDLGAGPADTTLSYGRAGDLPVIGDWNRDGADSVGVVRGNRWLLRETNTGGEADLDFAFGREGDETAYGRSTDDTALRVDEPEEESAGTASSAAEQEDDDAWAPAAGWGTWDALAQCESGGRWDINTGNGFYGGLQFSLRSWRAVGGSGYPHQASREEQIYRGERLQAIQGWGAWPHCSSRIGLR